MKKAVILIDAHGMIVAIGERPSFANKEVTDGMYAQLLGIVASETGFATEDMKSFTVFTDLGIGSLMIGKQAYFAPQMMETLKERFEPPNMSNSSDAQMSQSLEYSGGHIFHGS
ncbi:uncharacterized protein KY384_009216 [Bacidia gigantensis]|uniref:uncharacterized protein n=1 Tax=Bacidia gigantensis TaxID=2732470 RepID=UPI001D04FD12|nr:uncharacterized protein KY384_009216 [Bacidia gigantensis]KAG8525572.1 hypothetical protein KY384_009216 [Bacidia gigantensis]